MHVWHRQGYIRPSRSGTHSRRGPAPPPNIAATANSRRRRQFLDGAAPASAGINGPAASLIFAHVSDRKASPPGCHGISHTRWATHGPANDRNAHPHLSSDGTVAVVHNGVIENYAILKKQLQEEGVIFRSDTDTEVIAQLLQQHYDGDPRRSGP